MQYFAWSLAFIIREAAAPCLYSRGTISQRKHSSRMIRCTRMKVALSGALLSSLVAAHAIGAQSRIVELHPTPENIPEVTDPRFILHEEPGLTFIDDDSHEKLTIGVEEGEPHEIFGWVTDLAIPGDSTVLVVDQHNSEVRVFDYGGALLTTFGRPGEGPGEFRKRPFTVSVADRGKSVFVLEQFGRTVAAFDRLDPSRFAPKLHIQPNVLSISGCAMNGHYWVFGAGDDPAHEGVLHKFNYEGAQVASFLERYKSPRERVSWQMSRSGLLACSEAHGVVALIRDWAPVITGYRENGEMAWRVKIAGFDPNYVAEFEDGTIGMAPMEPGHQRIDAVFTDLAGDFYVQYTTLQGRGSSDHRSDRGPLFKISAKTGRGMYLGTAPNLAGFEGGYGFAYVMLPFPHVVIYKPKAPPD